MSIARLEGDVSTIEADMQSPSLGQPAPTVFEATRNVVSLLGAHAALVGFWALVLEAPLGLPLVWLAPLACVLHQKAMSEWMHEAAHWHFLPSRKWNDRAIQLFAASLFFDDVEEHRRAHFAHHPGRVIAQPLPAAKLLRGLARDLSGRTAIEAIRARAELARARPVTRARRQARVAVGSALAYIALASTLASFAPKAWIAVPIYLATLATLHPAFQRIRAVAQPSDSVAEAELLLRTSLLDRAIVSSRVTLLHASHHASPTLPFRQLERLAATHALTDTLAETVTDTCPDTFPEVRAERAAPCLMHSRI
jgi:fatty acid desaturase